MTECVLFLHGHQPFYNEEFIVKEVTWQSYGPFFKMLLDLSKEYSIKVNLSLTGSLIQWFEKMNNEFLLSAIGELVDREIIELLASPFYHAPLVFTDDGFIKEQIFHHKKMIRDMFGVEARGFFPPELVYSTHKNYLIENLDIDYLVIEGDRNAFFTDDIEGIWRLNTKKNIGLLARNRALSWHFSDNTFPNGEWLLETIAKREGPITIGSDLECFGHHRGADSFKFLDYLLKKAEENDVQFCFAKEVVKNHQGELEAYHVEDVTTWARSINVFFPHSKIIEMWFTKNDTVSTYHRIEYFYFKLENALQNSLKMKENNFKKKQLEKLYEIKMKEIDDIRWIIYRELTDAALYHEDFSNENTYRSLIERCGYLKGQLWEIETKLEKIMKKLCEKTDKNSRIND
ncbi:MAG: hypothetical protein GF308_01495 [Candidatus Heimdallarchaeota archaeon]|nr:hypothetical protein [Candidatus Heimdallarchaeota archaeon]